MLAKPLLILFQLLSICGLTSALSCEWTSDVGQLMPYITSGTVKTITVTSEDECRAQCMQQTTFICASVNYKVDSKDCELLAENNQTASISRFGSNWRYSIRPLCAGIWQPWTAVKGHYLNTEVVKYNQIETGDLRDCMTSCLQDIDSTYNCSSIVKALSGGQCELVNKRSADPGVSRETHTDYQYFDLPLCYSDNSVGATNTALTDYGSAGIAFMLLTNYTIEVDGYLVGWKYRIARTTNYCDSYAAIWRKTGTGSDATYSRITETLLKPEDASTGGINFQFVQNSREVVRKGDFPALYVEKPSGSSCSGNLVSFTPNNGGPTAQIRHFNPNKNRVDILSGSAVRNEPRLVALRVYIAELLELSEDPTSSHSEVSPGQIRIEWNMTNSSSNQQLAGNGYVKMECSGNSNFNTLIDCHSELVPINNRQIVIKNLDVKLPYYARVSTVRNYNGEELIENVYTVNSGSAFCAEREHLSVKDISITESGTLQPGQERTITISISSLKDDSCVSDVTLAYGTGQQANQNKTGPWAFTVEQGVTSDLVIKVRLSDGHVNTIWKQKYSTTKVPSAPEGLKLTRYPTATEFSWSALIYNDLQSPILEYEATCTVTNNTYNTEVVINSLTIYKSSDPSTNSIILKPLHSQVEYRCTVKALLSGNGFGESSGEIQFWSQPQVLKYNNTSADAVIRLEKTVTIPLPVLTSPESVLRGYDSLVVAVERLSVRRRRSITADRIDNITVYITAAFPITNYNTSFNVGDNQKYGGYWNRPLDPNYVYSIAVGFKAKSEANVLEFYEVPGAQSIAVRQPAGSGTSDGVAVETTPGGGGVGGAVGGAVGGIVAVVVVVVVVIVVIRRRRSPGVKKQESPLPETSRFPTEKPTVAVKPSVQSSSVTVQHETTPPATKPKTVVHSGDGDADNAYENALVGVVPTRPIPVSKLHTVIETEIKSQPGNPFKDEFLTIKAPISPCKIGRLSVNVKKNRFKNITASDSNRVVLKVTEGYDTDYVNANYIQDYHGRNSFIASQGPNEATVEDMWRLIHDSNTSTIVMLTNPVEATKVKCAVYWPEQPHQAKKFGQFQVTLMEEQQFAEYVVRKLKYVFNNKSRQVQQFHFTQWPDHGVPTTSGLLSFRHRVKQDSVSHQKPALVHCSAGVGRTGTFIGLDILIDEAKETSANGSEGSVDVLKCVYNMRSQRTQMVQTDEQYAFLYEIVAEALDCGDTSVACSQLPEVLAKWRKQREGGKSTLEDQFKKVKTATAASQARVPLCATAIASENINKNRDHNLLPVDKYRIILPYTSDARNGYINAVYCDGYQTRRGFLVTQTPLEDTIEDFWQMIVENKSSVIVYFNDCQEENLYWPASSGEQMQSGKINIQSAYSGEMTSMASSGVTETELTLTHGMAKHDVTLIEIKMDRDALPTTNQLTSLCKKLERFATSGHDVITVQCRNGSRLTGIFVIAMNLYLRARIEQEVDIVLEVKLARRSRPQFIPDFESFDLLYEFVSSYLSDFNDYSNFR